MSEQHPKKIIVFISYSWDDEPHKQWVEMFASRLVDAGFEVRLDKWDTDFGDDLAVYMESSVRDSHRVLMICTAPYVRKADAGKGGVGYEKMIVTGELARDLGTRKFVPVIRQGTGEVLTPTFLSIRRFIDFRNDAQFEETLVELIESLNNTVISNKPVAIPVELTPVSGNSAVVTREDISVYARAMQIIPTEDMLSWRKLVQQKKREFKANIIEWRAAQEASPPNVKSELPARADQMIELASPLIMLALAGVESGNPEFSDQRALLDEFIDLPDWPQAGRTVLVAMPETLGFVYHCLHGAAALSAGQIPLAIELATTRINHHDVSKPVFDDRRLTGWSESLGTNCLVSWDFLFSAFPRWLWLADIFGDEHEYQMAIVAYFMVLNFIEYMDSLRANIDLTPGQMFLAVPPCFLNLPDAITRKAVRLAAQGSDEFIELAKAWNVSRNHAVVRWPDWVEVLDQWGSVQDRIFRNSNPMRTFMVDMGWASPVTLQQKP